MMWNRRSDAWLGIGMTAQHREEAFERLETQGKLTRAAAGSMRHPLFMLSTDLPLMEKVIGGQADTGPRLEFLAPLDPMIWDRRLIEALWGFRYSWEIYAPASRRQYGYYVLPILYGDHFIGRIEPRADRKTGVLTVSNVWLENGVRPTEKLTARIDSALRRLARLNGCIYEK